MGLGTIFLIAAGACFVAESLGVGHIKWWAAGVAFYLFSLAVGSA